MTQNQIKIAYLIKKIRYQIDQCNLSETTKQQFERIVWNSLPIVYPHFHDDHSKVMKDIEKRKRTKRRVNKYLHELCEMYSDSTIYFVTLTFDDNSLNSQSERTRHRYATWFLNKVSRAYIANVDYGSKKQREHYHAVCVFRHEYESPQQVKLEWDHGFSHIKPCGIQDNDHENKNKYRISSYILKLTNHAGKITAGKVFHSKMFDDPDELPF